MADAIDLTILNDAMPISWVLKPQNPKTTSSQSLILHQGKRDNDDDVFIRLPAGTYVFTVDYGGPRYGLESWFSIYLDPPGITPWSMFGQRNIEGPVVLRVTCPVENTRVKFYTTLAAADTSKDVFVGLTVYPVPLANKGP